MVVKDVFDKDIEKGSIVCYAITRGQSAVMRFGFVVNVTGGSDNRVTVQGYSKNFYYDPEYVDDPNDSYRAHRRARSQKKWTSTKGSTSHANVKMMVIHPDTLPEDLKDIMLEEARIALA